MDTYEKEISSFEGGLKAAWKASSQRDRRFDRIVFPIFLVAIVLIGVYGKKETLGYIVLLVALSVTILLRAFWIQRKKNKPSAGSIK